MDMENGIAKTLSKLSTYRQDVNNSFDEFISRIQSLKLDIEKSDSNELSSLQRVLLYQLVKELNDWSTSSVKEHRDVHGLISKLGKDIDKSFVMEFSSVIGEVHSLEDIESKKCVIQAIYECLLQHGLIDIADELLKEAEVDNCDIREGTENSVNGEMIAELNRVVDCLKNDHSLQAAMEWCEAHRIELDNIGSSVEFEIHRLAFLSELQLGEHKTGPEAMQWRMRMLALARKLSPFAKRYPSDVQALMGCLAFVGTPRTAASDSGASPSSTVTTPLQYQELASVSPTAWISVADLFHKTACQLLGLPKRSAVETAIIVGARAVPPLFQIIQVVQRRQCQGFLRDMESELPIEIPIPDDCVFHSIFACPILKQQTTPTNPPLRLACGHVISREVLTKLAVGNRIRCPYCPNIDQNPNDARPVFF